MTAAETRTRLLEIALELIWRRNYDSVGVNEICSRAGVTKGSFYHHFESKAELFCEATDYYWGQMKQEMDDIFSASRPALEQLQNLIRFIFAAKLDSSQEYITGCPFFSSGAMCGCGEKRVTEALQEMAGQAIKYNLALVRTLAAEGYLEAGVDQEQTARLLHQYIQGVMNFAQMHDDRELVRRDLPTAVYSLLQLKKEYWQQVDTGAVPLEAQA